jgi:hypothetical protein
MRLSTKSKGVVPMINKELREHAKNMNVEEARALVDSYYEAQGRRIDLQNKIRAIQQGKDENINPLALQWQFELRQQEEKDIASALNWFAKSNPVGKWSMEVMGIGPVIAAGLLAHIDITQAPTAGHIQAYAGLDPTKSWEKGQKRPWNARIKTLCWKIGESFVKVMNNDKDVYGKLYLARKEYENEKNEAGEYKSQAESKAKSVGKNTEAYKSYSKGKLPAGHIHARCKRYSVKLFLSHWHRVAYLYHYKCEPPKPYAIEILGHAHEIECPGIEKVLQDIKHNP